MLTIRLRRAGAKRDPHYRVVVTDRASGRDGAFLEILGHYHPRKQPAEIVFDLERADGWIKQGAQMSDTVSSLYRKVRRGAAGGASTQLAAAAEIEAAEPGAAPADEASEE